jgi:hypothetical protein
VVVVASSSLLAARTYCSSMKGLEVLLGMVDKTVKVRRGGGEGWTVANLRIRSEISGSEEKKLMALITMLEKVR